MAKSGFIKDKKSWKGFAFAINSKGFNEEIKKQISKANKRVGERVVRAVQMFMKKGVPPDNHALTAAIKGSKKPLIDHGDLLAAITYKEISWNVVYVGVLRTNDEFNVAVRVHNGGVVPVTEKMRQMFLALWKVSTDQMGPEKLKSERAQDLWERYKQWRPIKKGVPAISIPSRPFMTMAFADPKIGQVAKKIWVQAVHKTLQKRSSRGKKPKGK